MAYTAWSVVFGEQPTAAKWNQLGENDAGFKTGANIDTDAITPIKIPNRTRYVSFGYTKAAMNDGSTIVGIPLTCVSVPTDWVSGTDIVIKCSSRNTVGSNVVKRNLDVYRFRDAAALSALASATNVNRTVASTNVVYSTLYTVAAASLAAGDKIGIILSRVGADGTDTNTGIEDVDAAWIEYTADC